MIRAVSSIEDLEARARAAQAAPAQFNQRITEKYREEIPGAGDDAVLARAKARTDQERAEWKRLDDAARQAYVELSRARQTAEGHTSGG
jgi:hypothetical protein